MVKMCVELKTNENNENLKNNHSYEEQDGVELDMDSEDEATEVTNDLNFQKLGGGSLIDHAPIVHPSGNSFFLICYDIVKYFSATSGALIWQFQCMTQGDRLVNVQIPLQSRSSQTLVGCTKTGKLIKWNIQTGKQAGDLLDMEINKQSSIRTFNLINFNDSAVAGVRELDETEYLAVFDLSTGKQVFKYNITLKPKVAYKVALSNKAHQLMAVVQEDQLIVMSTDSMKQQRNRALRNMNNNKFTALVFHPTEDALATGDSSGRIIIWHNLLNNNNRRPVTEIYHWHHTSVQTIAFTEAGTYFYSGGYEAVLVKWVYNNAQHKDFLARLSAPIGHIAMGRAQIILTTIDNAVQIYDTQFKLQQVLQDFTWSVKDFTGFPRFPIGLKINPRTQSLVLNGRVGQLQFFSTYTNRLLYNLDVTMTNYLCPERTKLLFNVRVTHCCLTNDWLATAEYWNDFENSPEVRIKFFAFNEILQSFSLNTNVEMPHNTELVGLEFSHTYSSPELICASAGHDRTIKIWALQKSANVYRQGKAWMCINVLTYKNLPVFSINFSRDGSILAAGFGHILCLWDTSTWRLKQTLSAPPGADGHIGKLNIFIPTKSPSKKTIELNSRYEKSVFEFLEGENEHIITDVTKTMKRRIVDLKREKLYSLNNPDVKTQIFKKVSQDASYLSVFHKTRVFSQMKMPILVKGEDNNITRYMAQKHKRLYSIRKQLRRKVLTISRIKKYPICVKLDTFLKNPATRFKHRPKWFKRKQSIGRNPVKKLNKDAESQSDDENESENSNELSSSSESEDEEQELEKQENHKKIHNHGVIKTGRNVYKQKNQQKIKRNKPKDVLKPPTTIRFIAFGSNDHCHLLLISTAHRIIVWNLLTLKIEVSIEDEVRYLSLDSLTNLVAVVTAANFLKVFHINDLMPIYTRSIPPIYGMIWVPRRQPKSRTAFVDWQATSQLIFLNQRQELIHLTSANEYNTISYYELTNNVIGNSNAKQTAYATILNGKKQKHQTARHTVDWTVNKLTGKGLNTIKEFTLMQTYAMAPLYLLCESFTQSLTIKSDVDENTPNGIITDSSALGVFGLIHKNDETSDEEDTNKIQTDEESVTSQLVSSKIDVNVKVLQTEKQLKATPLEFLDCLQI